MKAHNNKTIGELSGEIWAHIKWHAKRRKILFNITQQEAWDLFIDQNKKCALSGVDIKFRENYKDRGQTTASLDRKDSTKGYTLDNIQWIHKDLNRLKWKLSQERFIELCKLITKKRGYNAT